jgi:hypothetical protein
MRVAHIIDNRVHNILVVNDLSFPVKEGFLVEDTGEDSIGGWAEIGGSYIDNKFHPPESN